MLREVRWSKVDFMRVSSRVMALDTVACDGENSAAALANEPVSATLAKIAHPAEIRQFSFHIPAKSRADDSRPRRGPARPQAASPLRSPARGNPAGCALAIGLRPDRGQPPPGSCQEWKGWNSFARVLRPAVSP